MQLYQDIPRICTAIAEWGACVVYLYLIRKEKMKSFSFWLESIAALVVQVVFLTFTGDLPTVFWIPCMAVAASVMYLLLCRGC